MPIKLPNGETVDKMPSAYLWMYRNPDKRCTYPFSPDPLGYCWSYAEYVDGNSGKKTSDDMKKICRGCECWNASKMDKIKNKIQEVIWFFKRNYAEIRLRFGGSQ